MPTPHNNAVKGDFAKTVLMPGDPLRAKFIAETFLTDPKLVNNVRGVQGYTGTYKGVPVSVMASGMGMPSIGIYSYELYTQYDVENIIRVGSAGAMRADLELGSVVAGQGACTNSSFADQYELGGSFARLHRQAGAGHLLHLRQSYHRRRIVRRRATDHLHQHDEDRAGDRC